MVDVDAPQDAPPTHAPQPQPPAVPPPKPSKKATKPHSQPSEPQVQPEPQAAAGTEDTRKRPRSPLDEEALAKRVAAEVVQQVRGVSETAAGHGGSGSGSVDPRGARSQRRSSVQTEVHGGTGALEALLKELVAKNQCCSRTGPTWSRSWR